MYVFISLFLSIYTENIFVNHTYYQNLKTIQTKYKRCLISFIQFSNGISNSDHCDKIPRRIHSELIALQFLMLFFFLLPVASSGGLN